MERQPSLLLVEAHRAAYHQAKKWIRSVFQEVHCSLWRDHWRVNYDSNEKCHITEPMIAQAQQVCRRVARQWCQQLEAEGHFDFAKWVVEVLETEESTFFLGEETTVTGNDNALWEEEEEEATALTPPTQDHEKISVENEDESQETNTDNNESLLQQKVPLPTASCPLAALKKLRLPTHDETMTQSQRQREQYVIDQIDAMGQTGKTYWPFEWDIIQQAANKVPERLYKSKKNFQLKLVPKSQQQQNNNNNDDPPLSSENNNTEEEEEPMPPDNPTMPPPEPRAAEGGTSLEDIKMVVDYQRNGNFFRTQKYKRKEAANNNNANNNKRQKTSQEEPSRPPYLTDHVEIPWNPAVAQQIACPALDAYLQRDDDNSEEDECVPHTMLGALKTLGHIHNAIQIRHDYDEGEFESFTAKKQRRKFTRSVKERLGPNQMEKVPRKHKVQSKVKRTMNESGDTFKEDDDDDEEEEEEEAPSSVANKNRTGTRFYVDFDMGECLLDLEADNSGTGIQESGRIPRRRLYAFSGLEVCLLDEDGPEDDKKKNRTSNETDDNEVEDQDMVAVLKN